jgi:phage terminase small subunit
VADKPLSIKHSKFVDEYLRCFNGTQAYLLVYPKTKADCARANAARLIATDSIKAEIASRLAEAHMTADEALKRLADMARGDVTEFITPFGAVDLDAVKAAGKGHLIKKIKQRTITKIGKGERDEDTEVHDTEIELHDAQAAIDKILKVHGKYKDAIELPETLKIQIVKASDATSNK